MNPAVSVRPAKFLDCAVKTSSRGDYYAFNIITAEGRSAYCIVDAIHSGKIEFLLQELEAGRSCVAPVKLSRGRTDEYRIDLDAINRGFWPTKPASAPERPKYPPVAKSERIRAQFEIEEHKLEALKKLAIAERYESYTDWLRAVVDRALEAAGGQA